jgi:LmbE family N-acetylglucosaminyl deacetylase
MSAGALRFGPRDRLWIVAPHPDDEVLGAAGAILQARQAGAAVRVAYLTHGDTHVASAIFYFKRLFKRADGAGIGLARAQEARRALACLGVPAEALAFLGYPDGGLLPIWNRHWGAAKPYRNAFTGADRVPYADSASFGRAHRAENLLEDLHSLLAAYRPTHVLVTAPFDRHPDHRAAHAFACRALRDTGVEAQIYRYLVHARGWPWSRAARAANVLGWVCLTLTPSQVAAKRRALARYESQLGYRKRFLMSFVRRHEHFLPLPAGPTVPEPLEHVLALGAAL